MFKKRTTGGIAAALLVLLLLGAGLSRPARPQLQQSGGAGSSTSIVQGGNTATVSAGGALKVDGSAATQPVSGTVTANQGGAPWSQNLTQVGGNTLLTGNGITGTGSQRVTIASDQTAFTVNAAESGTWTVQPGNTVNTSAWFVKTVPATGCGTTFVDSGAITLPTSSTAVTNLSATCCVWKIFLSNTTSSAVTITITDGQGSPVTYVSAFSLPGNSNLLLDMGGIKFITGIKWSAGTGSAITGQVTAWQ